MSENYRALTRKYRPNSFEDIVSQDHVSNTLLNAIKQNRLSHAYMFCGPRGVGKTTMARVLARVINQIDADVDGEALNQTMSITEMDAASNNKVEDVHHLREIVRIPPQNSLYKVIIVDEVHMLSKAAFNALLKTLEEPPKHVVFIFATTEPHKVLPTILSRVQRFDFKRIAVEEIVERLRKISIDEQIAIDEESLHVIAKKADGALRDALGLMDQAIAFCGDTITHNELLQALNVVGTDRLFEFMSCVKEHNANKGLELINTLLQEGYDIQEFLIGLTEHLRNLYIAHHSPQLYLVEASEETKTKYTSTATEFSRDDLMRMLHLVSEAQIKLKDASQPRIQFEITLLKLIHMERSENLKKLLAEFEDLKKNSRNLGAEEVVKQRSENQKLVNSVPEYQNASKKEQPLEHRGVDISAEQTVNTREENSVSADSELVQTEEGFKSALGEKKEFESQEVLNSESVQEVVNEPIPVHDEYELGQPALVTEVTQKAKVLHFPHGNGTPKPDPKVLVEVEESISTEKLLVEDVRAIWDEFIASLENNVAKVLELQVQRVQPVKLKGNELFLECDNAFAQKMLDEQAQDLSLRLKEYIGVKLRFKTEVKRGAENASKAKNPYERFKEIQQKDPIIRDLVERFGAELEY